MMRENSTSARGNARSDARTALAFSLLWGMASACPIPFCILGDSLTAGSTAAGKQSYGGLVERICMKSNGRFLNLYYPATAAKTNAWESYGVSGLSVDGHQTQTYRWYANRDKVKVKAYWLGHNDMPNSGSPWNASQINVFFQKWKADVNGLRAFGTVVIPFSLVHTTSKDRATVIAVNAKIKQFCVAEGLPYIDLFTVTDGQQATYCFDGTHFNDLGLDVVADEAIRQLDAIFGPKQFGWMPVGSSTGSQTGVLKNQFGSMTAVALGTAGYGGTPATFTTSVLTAASEGLASDAVKCVKTGGQSGYIFDVSTGGTTGYVTGDLVMFHCKIRTKDCMAGDTMLYLTCTASGGHGAGYIPVNGIHDTDDQWRTFMCVYKVPASTTNLTFTLIARPQTTASTSTTGEISVAEICIVNLTTMGLEGLAA